MERETKEQAVKRLCKRYTVSELRKLAREQDVRIDRRLHKTALAAYLWKVYAAPDADQD